jgi:hypothetical protein
VVTLNFIFIGASSYLAPGMSSQIPEVNPSNEHLIYAVSTQKLKSLITDTIFLRFGAQTAKIDTFYAINNCGDM